MKLFKEYYLENAIEERLTLGKKFEKEIVDAMRDELETRVRNKQSAKYSIKAPNIQYQKQFIIDFLKSKSFFQKDQIIQSWLQKPNPYEIVKILSHIEKNYSKTYNSMIGNFGAEFGDIVISKNFKDSPKFSNAIAFIDTKTSKKMIDESAISLRSLMRFGNEISSKQKTIYIVGSAQTSEIYVIFFNSFNKNDVIKKFNSSFNVNATKEDLISSKYHETIKTTHKDFYVMPSGEIGIKISSLLEVTGANSKKSFTDKKQAATHILNLVRMIDQED